MLIQNPLADPLFLPAFYRFGGLLTLSLLVIVYLERRNIRRLWQAPLFIKWRTWGCIAPIYLLAVLSGGLTTTLLIVAITLQGLREYADLVDLAPSYRQVSLVMGALAAPVAWLSIDAFHLLAPLLLLAATIQPLAFANVSGGIRNLAFAALGWAYIAWLLAHLALIGSHIEEGRGLLLVVGTAVALSDQGAYALGKLFGRRKLAPRLSPNKTLEGAVGNLFGAWVGTLLMGFALPTASYWIIALLLPLIVAVGSLWGDLVESAIKRESGVKDAGAWLPGFGGLLDRIDSLILVAPLSYYFLILIR